MSIHTHYRSAHDVMKHEWDTHATHPLQSWAWGEFRAAMGVDLVRLAGYQNDVLTQSIQCTFHNVPYTPYTVGYFPKGPLPTKDLLQALTACAKDKNAIYIQLEPNTTTDISHQTSVIRLLKPSHHPLFPKYTFVLDLTKPEDELLSRMHPKTRYNIRLARKKGVKVQEETSEKAFTAYLALTDQTTKRQGFYAHSKKYHTTMWHVMKKAGIAKLFTATYNNEVLAAWILFIFHDTVYYPYGATSRIHRNLMAPNLLLWEIARWAKKDGYRYFDLWGALGPDPDEHDPWYGFHRFKAGYNPDLVTFSGSYDLISKPLLYTPFTVLTSIRRTAMKLQIFRRT